MSVNLNEFKNVQTTEGRIQHRFGGRHSEAIYKTISPSHKHKAISYGYN